MDERLSISFADRQAGVQGVAIAGVGTLLRLGEELRVGAPPLIVRGNDFWQVTSPGTFELSLRDWGLGARLGDGGAHVVLAAAAGTVGAQRIDGVAVLRSACAAIDPGFTLERSLAILFDRELSFALDARRPRGAAGHGDELAEAFVFHGEPPEPTRFDRPRLSSTYGAGGELTHAGLELWETEDSDRPTRIGGEALAHGVLTHPGGASTSVTFVAWHHDGRHGLGSYLITTPPG